MYFHLTRDSDILALIENSGRAEWLRISVEQLQSALDSVKDRPGAAACCSVDDPDKFEINPPKASKLIVQLMVAHEVPVEFVRIPPHPVDREGGASTDADQSKPESEYDMSAVLKVSALSDGSILADGQGVSMDALGQILSALAERRGIVWYYREEGRAELHPNALETIDLIAKHELPISMSSMPDFSDSIDADGNSRPRSSPQGH